MCLWHLELFWRENHETFLLWNVKQGTTTSTQLIRMIKNKNKNKNFLFFKLKKKKEWSLVETILVIDFQIFDTFSVFNFFICTFFLINFRYFNFFFHVLRQIQYIPNIYLNSEPYFMILDLFLINKTKNEYLDYCYCCFNNDYYYYYLN